MEQKGMKLGKDTISYHNWIYSLIEEHPRVGRGMTRLMWSDRIAYEVVDVSEDGKRVTVQEFNYVIKDPYDGYAELRELRPFTEELRYRYGSWWKISEKGSNSRWSVRWGVKETYIDPHF